MTSRERLIKTLNRELPDRVPVAPDTSNMIPARLTGKPFWDLYLYQDPPIWKAYIDCVKHFGFDSLLDGYVPIQFEELGEIDRELVQAIIYQDDEKIITRFYKMANGKRFWTENVNIYPRTNPYIYTNISKMNMPKEPGTFKDVEGIKQGPAGEELLKLAKCELGDHGLLGVFCGTTGLIRNDEEIYDAFDNPEKYAKRSEDYLKAFEKRFYKLMSLETKPDFICLGFSGTLVFQTVDFVKEYVLPITKKMSKLAKENGLFSHVHSCGPEAQLVKMFAEETDLTIIDPLEIAPMGNCNLKELKRLYGDKIVLKGNLHTTNTMLQGTVEEVIAASCQAIDDAAEGGGFVLSTGDQCGRDTPDANIFAMLEAAEKHGRY